MTISSLYIPSAFGRKKVLFQNYLKKIYFTVYFRHFSIKNIRVRFAPSPTGFLHLGGIRTALYNYLFAKSQGGRFILRIEDTDTSRTIPGCAKEIEKDLEWLSLYPDESPKQGGAFGPYIQSQRASTYQEHVQDLLQNGFAYRCFCSKDRLTSLKNAGSSYDNKCRTLTANEIRTFIEKKMPYCIRLKQAQKTHHLNDLIFGERSISLTQAEGDSVILKTNGLPTYHLASVIDDHLMGITHVLRGDEWILSAPKHLQIYKALKWEPPVFAHLPRILNLDGTKLSKRQEDLHIKQLRSEGFYPEAILNFAKLSGGGFEHINHEALVSMDELIQKFRIDRINTNSAPFDLDRLRNYNRLQVQRNVQDKNKLEGVISSLKDDVLHTFKNLDVHLTDSYLEKIVLWSQDRIYTIKDLVSPQFQFLWEQPGRIHAEEFQDLYPNSKYLIFDTVELLKRIGSSSFSQEDISTAFKAIREKHKIKTTCLMKILRLSFSATKVGPPVAETAVLLGKERCLNRLYASLSSFQ